MRESQIVIPTGRFETNTNRDDQEAANRRRELRERMLRGERIVVNQQGQPQTQSESTRRPNQPTLEVPPGKLA
jgi:hypothetical protein